MSLSSKLAVAALAVSLAACGGSSSSSRSSGSGGGDPAADPVAGRIIDSPVQGLRYLTSPGAESGVTNVNGVFEYVPSDAVTFSIGSLTLGSVQGSSLVTLLDLVSGARNAHQSGAALEEIFSTYPQVLNIARLLQSLDVDGDSSNGIQIPFEANKISATYAGQINFSDSQMYASDDKPAVKFICAVKDSRGESACSSAVVTSEEDARTEVEDTEAQRSSGSPINFLPNVEVGADISAVEGAAVTLSGVASDSDGTIDSLLWQQTDRNGVPISGNIELTNADSNQAAFTAPDVDESRGYYFSLSATDNDGGQAYDVIRVLVSDSAVNIKPQANAGEDQTVTSGNNVSLDGSGSADSDGAIVSYTWQQQIMGEEPAVELTNANNAEAGFVAPAVTGVTQLHFLLTVVDDDNASSNDQQIVTVQPGDTPPDNQAPTADAGEAQVVLSGEQVLLAGSGSDPDGDEISYAWTQVKGPAVTIDNADQAEAIFTAPEVTEQDVLTFKLTVSDSGNLQASAQVDITVSPQPSCDVTDPGTYPQCFAACTDGDADTACPLPYEEFIPEGMSGFEEIAEQFMACADRDPATVCILPIENEPGEEPLVCDAQNPSTYSACFADCTDGDASTQCPLNYEEYLPTAPSDFGAIAEQFEACADGDPSTYCLLDELPDGEGLPCDSPESCGALLTSLVDLENQCLNAPGGQTYCAEIPEQIQNVLDQFGGGEPGAGFPCDSPESCGALLTSLVDLENQCLNTPDGQSYCAEVPEQIQDVLDQFSDAPCDSPESCGALLTSLVDLENQCLNTPDGQSYCAEVPEQIQDVLDQFGGGEPGAGFPCDSPESCGALLTSLVDLENQCLNTPDGQSYCAEVPEQIQDVLDQFGGGEPGAGFPCDDPESCGALLTSLVDLENQCLNTPDGQNYCAEVPEQIQDVLDQFSDAPCDSPESCGSLLTSLVDLENQCLNTPDGQSYCAEVPEQIQDVLDQFGGGEPGAGFPCDSPESCGALLTSLVDLENQCLNTPDGQSYCAEVPEQIQDVLDQFGGGEPGAGFPCDDPESCGALLMSLVDLENQCLNTPDGQSYCAEVPEQIQDVLDQFGGGEPGAGFPCDSPESCGALLTSLVDLENQCLNTPDGQSYCAEVPEQIQDVLDQFSDAPCDSPESCGALLTSLVDLENQCLNTPDGQSYCAEVPEQIQDVLDQFGGGEPGAGFPCDDPESCGALLTSLVDLENQCLNTPDGQSYCAEVPEQIQDVLDQFSGAPCDSPESCGALLTSLVDLENQCLNTPDGQSYCAEVPEQIQDVLDQFGGGEPGAGFPCDDPESCGALLTSLVDLENQCLNTPDGQSYCAEVPEQIQDVLDQFGGGEPGAGFPCDSPESCGALLTSLVDLENQCLNTPDGQSYCAEVPEQIQDVLDQFSGAPCDSPESCGALLTSLVDLENQCLNTPDGQSYCAEVPEQIQDVLDQFSGAPCDSPESCGALLTSLVDLENQCLNTPDGQSYCAEVPEQIQDVLDQFGGGEPGAGFPCDSPESCGALLTSLVDLENQCLNTPDGQSYCAEVPEQIQDVLDQFGGGEPGAGFPCDSPESCGALLTSLVDLESQCLNTPDGQSYCAEVPEQIQDVLDQFGGGEPGAGFPCDDPESCGALLTSLVDLENQCLNTPDGQSYCAEVPEQIQDVLDQFGGGEPGAGFPCDDLESCGALLTSLVDLENQCLNTPDGQSYCAEVPEQIQDVLDQFGGGEPGAGFPCDSPESCGALLTSLVDLENQCLNTPDGQSYCAEVPEQIQDVLDQFGGGEPGAGFPCDSPESCGALLTSLVDLENQCLNTPDGQSYCAEVPEQIQDVLDQFSGAPCDSPESCGALLTSLVDLENQCLNTPDGQSYCAEVPEQIQDVLDQFGGGEPGAGFPCDDPESCGALLTSLVDLENQCLNTPDGQSYCAEVPEQIQSVLDQLGELPCDSADSCGEVLTSLVDLENQCLNVPGGQSFCAEDTLSQIQGFIGQFSP